MKTKCNSCSSSFIKEIIEIPEVPVFCNVLFDTAEEALEAVHGRIALFYCSNCGHIFNAAFDPELLEYGKEYENSLHFSPKFNDFAKSLAKNLIDKYDIRNKTVVDVGCGKGDFLKMITTDGNNKGYGFDKSYVPSESDSDFNIEFINDYFSEEYKDIQADLLLCRHVLEHIERPETLIKSVSDAITENSTVFFEVPNALYTVKDLGIWDIIYEHCSYFTPASLTWLFKNNGFKVLDIYEKFMGQYLCIEAGLSSIPENKVTVPEAYDSLISNFSEQFGKKLEYWDEITREKAEEKIILWGAGSKGVTFLNLINPHQVEFIIDLNPRKHNKFVPGTGQKIVSPDDLDSINPDTVIIMNPVYEEEIRSILSGKGLNPQILIA